MPLIWMVSPHYTEEGNDALVRLLMKVGADVHHRAHAPSRYHDGCGYTEEERTPLEVAVLFEHIDITDYLRSNLTEQAALE